MTAPAPHLHDGLDSNGYPAHVEVVDGHEICIHQHDIPASDRTTIDGIPVTTALRTVIDIAPEMTSVDLERVVRNALDRRLFGVDDAVARVEQPDLRHRPGGRRLRALLLERYL